MACMVVLVVRVYSYDVIDFVVPHCPCLALISQSTTKLSQFMAVLTARLCRCILFTLLSSFTKNSSEKYEFHVTLGLHIKSWKYNLVIYYSSSKILLASQANHRMADDFWWFKNFSSHLSHVGCCWPFIGIADKEIYFYLSHHFQVNCINCRFLS